MTATVIIAAFAVMGMLIVSVFATVTVRQALRDVVRAFANDATRRDAQLSAILDRFQAIDWENLVAMRSIEAADQEGGFLTPEEQAAESVVEVDEQVRWGPMSRLRIARERDEAEQALLAEDFPEDFEETKP